MANRGIFLQSLRCRKDRQLIARCLIPSAQTPFTRSKTSHTVQRDGDGVRPSSSGSSFHPSKSAAGALLPALVVVVVAIDISMEAGADKSRQYNCRETPNAAMCESPAPRSSKGPHNQYHHLMNREFGMRASGTPPLKKCDHSITNRAPPTTDKTTTNRICPFF